MQKPKAKGIGKKTAAPTKRAVKPILQLEWDAVEANQRPFRDQLPDLPPLDLEQDNIPFNPPSQPQHLPVEKKINSLRQRNQIKFQIYPLSQRNLIN